ncbi:hypothetical protein HDK77DRAFT_169430 [Phyllosticta capitalensis]
MSIFRSDFRPSNMSTTASTAGSLAGAARLIICSLLACLWVLKSQVTFPTHLINPSSLSLISRILPVAHHQMVCSLTHPAKDRAPSSPGVSCKNEKKMRNDAKNAGHQKPMKQPGEPNSHLLRVDVPNHCRRASPTPTLSTPINVAGPLLRRLVSSPPAKRN